MGTQCKLLKGSSIKQNKINKQKNPPCLFTKIHTLCDLSRNHRSKKIVVKIYGNHRLFNENTSDECELPFHAWAREVSEGLTGYREIKLELD